MGVDFLLFHVVSPMRGLFSAAGIFSHRQQRVCLSDALFTCISGMNLNIYSTGIQSKMTKEILRDNRGERFNNSLHIKIQCSEIFVICYYFERPVFGR